MTFRPTICAIVCMLLPNLSSADTVVLSFSNDRQYELAGYLFLPTSTTGTSTIDGIEADIDLSLSDALDLLDVAASFRAESWKGDWGLIFDANYLSLEANENLSRGGSVDGDVEQYWLAFLGTYRVSRGTLSGGQPYSIDVQAGVRYNSLKQKINISGPGTSLGGTETWWEPVIGARYAWKINEKWSGAVLADAGGFGVNDSDLQWSTTLSFDYSFDGARSLKLGVRYYSIDFSTNRPGGEFAYDASQVGPFIGYSYSF